MKNTLRWLPAFGGTFALGFYVGSPVFTQATHAAKYSVGIGIIVATMIATGFLCAITRGKKDNQQSSGFGYAARTRTGRN